MRLNLPRASIYLLLLLPALLLFYIRGPRRALTDSTDFGVVYGASRCWLYHANPYSHADVTHQYSLGHGEMRLAPDPCHRVSVYPPSAFPLIAAVAWLDWERAKQIWLALSLLIFGAGLVLISRSEYIPNATIRIVLISLFLLFAPVQSGLAKGQPSVVCIGLLVCAFYLHGSPRKELLSGFLLGLSCCLKPNIGLPYFLFCCWRRQWRVVAVSIAVILPVSIAALIQLQAFSPGWLPAFLTNLHTSSAPGGSMDPTIANEISYLLVNFQTLVGFFTTDPKLCNAVTYLLLGSLAIWVVRVAKPQSDPWLPLALLSTLVLLGSYHRYYDVQLLILGANATLEILRRRWQTYLWATLVIPGMLLWLPLHAIAGDNIWPPAIDTPEPFSHMVFKFFAFRNEPICLSLLAVTFALAIIRKPRRAELPVENPPPADSLEPAL